MAGKAHDLLVDVRHARRRCARRGRIPSNSGATPPTTKLTDLRFNDLSSMVVNAKPDRTVQVQLNWSECYQGKWTPRKSSDINRFTPFTVNDNFNPTSGVHVRASIDTDESGNETAVRIHMDGISQAFRLTSKNSEPASGPVYWQIGNYTPYTTSGWDATKNVGYLADSPSEGSPELQVNYLQTLTTVNGVLQTAPKFASGTILRNVSSFNVLLCDNLPPLDLTGGAYALYMSSLAAASSPFFYEDTSDSKTNKELTFFVQPNLVETSIRRWRRWAIRPSFPDLSINDPKYWNAIGLTSQVPAYHRPAEPDPEVIFHYQPNLDLVANQATLISYGTSAIGSKGRTLAGAAVSGLKAAGSVSNSRLLANLRTAAGSVDKPVASSGLDFARAEPLPPKP